MSNEIQEEPQSLTLSLLTFPASGEALRDQKVSNCCLPTYCTNAGAYFGQVGNTFGNNSKAARPFPLGRPAKPAQTYPANSTSISRKSKRCVQDYGPGLSYR